MGKTKRPKVVNIIAILMALTILRVMALTFLPTLNMLGGTSPNEWLGPWVTDGILGLFLPVVIYYILKGKGLKTWALLIVYNTLGAFDYATGLVTQWLHPLPIETASPSVVFISLWTTLLFQVVVIILFFKNDVIHHFYKSN